MQCAQTAYDINAHWVGTGSLVLYLLWPRKTYNPKFNFGNQTRGWRSFMFVSVVQVSDEAY
jgi:hypothetical protein